MDAQEVKTPTDTERLDFLDWLNKTLNEHTGSDYGWTLDVNHNRAQVWLRDNYHPKQTVREAIDEAMQGVRP